MINFVLIFEALAAAYLIFIGLNLTVENWQSAVIYKIPPLAIGFPLSYLAFGRLMGWPV